MMEEWDDYEQPTGLHYNPCDDYIADWAVNNPLKHCEHYNKVHQAEDWLDFQWAQTGHNGEHHACTGGQLQPGRLHSGRP